MSREIAVRIRKSQLLSLLVVGTTGLSLCGEMQAQSTVLFKTASNRSESIETSNTPPFRPERQDPQPEVKIDPQVDAQITTRPTGPLKVSALLMPNTSVKGIGTNILPEDAVAGRLPSPQSLPYGPDRDGGWMMNSKLWVAPVFCHYPTYYDDVMLEYHGQERCGILQPVLSGARFYTGLFFTPYLAYHQKPLTDISSAGHFRPGSTAPCIRQRAPYDPCAMRFQLLTTGIGVVALQP